MKLTKIEMESIILFNEEESMAEVYTHNVKLQNKMNAMVKDYPDIFKVKYKNDCGGITYIMPKTRLSIRPIKPISAERSKALSEQIKKTQAHKYKSK